MDSLRNTCRVCLKANDFVQLFDWHLPINANESLSYAECFQQCTQLDLLLNSENVYSDRPTKIYEYFCHVCAAKLKEAYLFIKMARESDSTLRSNLSGFQSETDKCFEWVGVSKNSPPLHTIKNQPIEEKIRLGYSKFFKNTICSERKQENERGYSYDNKAVVLQNKKSTKIPKKTENTLKSISKASKEIKNQNEYVICSACGKSMTKTELLHHSCNRNTKAFLCKSCPRTFRHRSTLVQHEQIHENNRERKYACNMCGKNFFTKMARKNHLKTHEPGRKPCFHCDQCDQSFLFKGNLLVHKQKHAGQTIECKYCQKQYVRTVDLEVHIRSHTGDTPFKCDKCEKAFTKRSSLQKHLHLHEGVQWKCDDCGKEYLYEWTLQRHRLEHTGMPLRCSICGKGFPEMYKIRRHIKGVHKVHITQSESFIVKLKEKGKN